MKTIKSIILSVFLLVAATDMQAQILQPDSQASNTAKPQVQIKVKKIYDKNGKVVQYDSTYVWTYHNGNENFHINMHQLMGDFKPFFRENLPDSLLQFFGDPGFNLYDSAMMLDFFNSDHFFDQWQKELFDMHRELRTMDSLRMEFLKKYMQEMKHPGKQKNPLNDGIY